ncbi:MgtC/SapB family protein [Aneurinibacillus sp. Ricciae_BoGa-3]|uniref:MgtC/SapB family protein n=1 Tax=Aneurinibacillus sp. Ricciae_BoGa-3 TaxID=3022697 RepID=UPI0023403F11|nr:MgtC/SapB family protein [Aneurinibacillus sp. Ricciae_BoGa-3]WCK53025.1 MgtC/SapB family protein [Aneurinibacillus sp. Ricciae_BoGa-3]
MEILVKIFQEIAGIDNREMYIRILLSACFGFCIGLERTSKAKPAGIKTYTFVSVASTLLTIVSIYAVARYSVYPHTNMDPMRLSAQVVSGLGFLGAGLIIQQGRSIHGLTSSAMVFFAGGMGIAIGAGFYGIAIFTMIVMYIVKRLGEKVEKSHTKSYGGDQEKEKD